MENEYENFFINWLDGNPNPSIRISNFDHSVLLFKAIGCLSNGSNKWALTFQL
jgi:hypothetical protein